VPADAHRFNPSGSVVLQAVEMPLCPNNALLGDGTIQSRPDKELRNTSRVSAAKMRAGFIEPMLLLRTEIRAGINMKSSGTAFAPSP
jgi:hypothetical protein